MFLDGEDIDGCGPGNRRLVWDSIRVSIWVRVRVSVRISVWDFVWGLTLLTLHTGRFINDASDNYDDFPHLKTL